MYNRCRRRGCSHSRLAARQAFMIQACSSAASRPLRHVDHAATCAAWTNSSNSDGSLVTRCIYACTIFARASKARCQSVAVGLSSVLPNAQCPLCFMIGVRGTCDFTIAAVTVHSRCASSHIRMDEQGPPPPLPRPRIMQMGRARLQVRSTLSRGVIAATMLRTRHSSRNAAARGVARGSRGRAARGNM